MHDVEIVPRATREEAVAAVRTLIRYQEQTTEQAGEHPHGQEEARPAGHPPPMAA